MASDEPVEPCEQIPLAARRLEGAGDLDDPSLIEEVADDLQADRQALAEAAGHADVTMAPEVFE